MRAFITTRASREPAAARAWVRRVARGVLLMPVALALTAPTAGADLFTDRPLLGVDRSSIAATTGDWDEANEQIRARAAAVQAPDLFMGLPAGVTVPGPGGFDNHSCGTSLVVSDLNGDGRGDIGMGCPGSTQVSGVDEGRLRVMTRNASGSGFSAGDVLVHPAPGTGDECTSSMDSGDVNGDGRTDLVIGCRYDDGVASNQGSAVLFTRKADNTGFDPGVVLLHPSPVASDECGQSVAVGDVNADGKADIAMGCRLDDAAVSNQGSVVVFVRKSDNTGFLAGVVVTDPNPVSFDNCGHSVTIGDVNGDGRGDLVTGCYEDDGSVLDIGSAIVLTRNAANNGFDAGVVLTHPTPNSSDLCGWSVAIGDANADGRRDVAMGCTFDSNVASSQGSVVLFLRTADNAGFAAGSVLEHPAPGGTDLCGRSVVISDFTGDGRGDLAMGCLRDDDDTTDDGSVVLFARTADNAGFRTEAVVMGQAGDWCGGSVGAGDVNGDGLPDLAMGCSRYNEVSSMQGAVVVTELPTPLVHPSPGAADGCGRSLAQGDLNADGSADVVTGCSLDDGAAVDEGRVTFFTRASTNARFDNGELLAHPAPAASDRCGTAVAVGDVNGDGRRDVAAGCDGDDAAAADQGSVVVFTRGAANTGFDAGVVLTHPVPAADACGAAVAIGDVDGDDLADVVMGCPSDDGAGADQGSVVVFTRKADNTGFDAGVVLTHPLPAASDGCGSSLAMGDVNDDGRADIAVGCAGDDGAALDQGSAIVFTRDATNAGFDPGVPLLHPAAAAGDACGSSMAIADVNGDGHGDVATGCPSDDGAVSDQGSVLVFARTGDNSGFGPGAVLEHPAPEAGDRCGASVAAGDINADGRADVATGCELDNAASTDEGTTIVFVRDGANTGFAVGRTLTRFVGRVADGCGTSVDIGDVDADSRAEVAMGCIGHDGAAADQGSVIVAANRTTARFAEDGDILVHPTPGGGDGCGGQIEMDIGDVNGDGLRDVAMGCYLDDGVAADEGSVVVRVRRPDNRGFEPGVVLVHPAPAASDQCGTSASIGDVNGDGLGDVTMGCWLDDGTASDEGSVVVFLRLADNSGFGPGTVLSDPTPTATAYCGNTARARDVNGDGKADIIVGCFFDDGAAADEGSTLVFLRRSDNAGFEPPTVLKHPTPAGGQKCGRSVTAGDVNGDGRADVVSGCFQDDGAQLDQGSAVVYTRTADNLAFDAGVVLTSASPGPSDFCGSSVAVGDVNADGRADVAMGCGADDTTAVNQGSVSVFTRTADNTGFSTAVLLTHSSTVGYLNCGFSVAMGDVNADGRADVAAGCYQDGKDEAGTVLLFQRDSANGGFEPGVVHTHPSPMRLDQCGKALGMGDATGDGRADILMGCVNDDEGTVDQGSAVLLDLAARSVVTSIRLNRVRSERIVKATVTLQTVLNGHGAPGLELSPDGGTTWESASSGVQHTFAGSGRDLRMRLRLPRNRSLGEWRAKSQVVHGVVVSYETVNTAPATPALVAPTAALITTDTTPDMVATFSDPDPGQTGRIDVQVCANSSCTATGDPVRAGSSASGIAIDANGTWTVTPALASGEYFWRAQAVDSKGATSSWSATRSFRVDAAPNVAVLVDPPDGAASADTTPRLTATFSDPDASDTGSVAFQVCANSSCTAVGDPVASGTSATGIVNGSNGTWTVPTALASGTYHWRARNEDQYGIAGSWSATSSLRIGTPSMTVSVSSATATISPSALVPGDNGTASTTVSVQTDNVTGYTVTATDESDTWGADQGTVGSIPDWSGTDVTPSLWPATTSGHWGITVRDATGGRLSKWGTGTGTLEGDFTDNLYAGLENTTATMLHTRTAFSTATDFVVVTYRTNVAASQPAGIYDATVSYTATANP